MYEDTSKFLSESSVTSGEFGPYVEKSIVALAIDHPDIFMSMSRFITPDLFESPECKYLIAIILNSLEKHQVVPTRNILHDMVSENLTVDDPFDGIFEIIDGKSDPREVPILKEKMIKWAKKRAYSLIYDEAAMTAFHSGNYDEIEKIIKDAQKITDLQMQGIWLLDSVELLMNPSSVEHRTTGFAKLDECLNQGGPSPKEVVCFLAPTNVGKCHTLNSKIFVEHLSNIYELEMEDGQVLKLAGFRKIKTANGMVRVCNLTDGDDIIELPTDCDGGIRLQDL
jgi:hypothetical protein